MVKTIEKNKENLINFTLSLGNGRFVYFKETPAWRSAWALGAAHYNQAIALAGALKEKLASQNLLLQNEALFKLKESNRSKRLEQFID